MVECSTGVGHGATYLHAYSIRFSLLSEEDQTKMGSTRIVKQVQLVSRYWKITEGNGETHEVRGEGVIGEYPVLVAVR